MQTVIVSTQGSGVTFGSKDPGRAAAEDGGAGECDFCVHDAGQSTQSLGSEDCYFYHNSI